MDLKKSGIRAGAVLVMALAAGHLVQTMNDTKTASSTRIKPSSIEQVSAGTEPAAATAPAKADPVMPATASLGGVATEAPKADPAPVLTAAEPVVPAPADTAPVLAALPDPAASVADGLEPPATDLAKVEPPGPAPLVDDAPAIATASDCSTDLALAAGPQAMIAVTLMAPCRAGERVVLRHAGLAVAEVLPADGKLILDLPALNATGEVSVLFPDAEIATGAVAIPEALAIRRFGMQWMADDAFQLHVLEAGADYNQPGHVWADAPVSPNGGYMMALGNPTLDLPMMAAVYTWPADQGIPADVMVESVVTEMTCGRELLGETLAMQGGTVTVTDLTLAMPECDALGDILVLKNPGLDVTLTASN
jgi:hypothetical protein